MVVRQAAAIRWYAKVQETAVLQVMMVVRRVVVSIFLIHFLI